MTSSGSSQVKERIRGSLLAAAAGDALGSAFEFVDSALIERELGSSIARAYHRGMPGSLMPGRPPGIPTDDTAMTLALIDALALPGSPTPASLQSGMVGALHYDGGRFASMFYDGAPGNACTSMLNVAARGAKPFESIDPGAGGNGAAMRAHPCGAFADRAFVAELSATQARLSHPYPAAVAAAQVVALIVHEAIYAGHFATELPPEVDEPEMRRAWDRAHRDLTRAERLPAHLRDADMAGWVTVATAHAIAQLYVDDPVRAIGMAAASGQDTDTVATIVGGMLGALHGTAMLPAEWLDGLQGRQLVEEGVETLYDVVRRRNGEAATPRG
jgi:ADP-ribosylglycohydrolase